MKVRRESGLLELSQLISLTNVDTLYTWVKYADNSDGDGISDDSTGKNFIGIAYNKTTPKKSTNPKDYTWSKIKGEQGVSGGVGPKGETAYLHIKYSDDGGKTFTSSNGEDVGRYIGQYTDNKIDDSSNPEDYKWSLIKGSSVIMANTTNRTATWEEAMAHVGKEENWQNINNWKDIEKGDILIIPIQISSKKNAIAYLYLEVKNKPTSSSVYGRGLNIQIGPQGDKGDKGPKGPEGPILDWVQDWNTGKTEIGGNKICSPRIFAGSVSNGKPTGVALGKNVFGNLKGYGDVTGLASYNNGNNTFSINHIGEVVFGNVSDQKKGVIKYNEEGLSIEAPTITLKGNDLHETMLNASSRNLIKNGSGEFERNHWGNNGSIPYNVDNSDIYGKCYGITVDSKGQLSGIKGAEILLKPNTDYIFQAMFLCSNNAVLGSSTSPLHFWCNVNSGNSGTTACNIVQYEQNYNTKGKWKKLFVHFKTKETKCYFTPFVHGNSFSAGSYVQVTNIMLTEGSLIREYQPYTQEIGTQIVQVTDYGLSVKSPTSNMYTVVDNDSFRVESNKGETIADFGGTTSIPRLVVGSLTVTNSLDSHNIPRNIEDEIKVVYYVDSSNGNDNVNNGLSTSKPFMTVEKALSNVANLDNREVDIHIKGSHNDISLKNYKGPGLLRVIFDNNSVIAGNLNIRGCTNVMVIPETKTTTLPTIKGVVKILGCLNIEVANIVFRKPTNVDGFNSNIQIEGSTQITIKDCDLGQVGVDNACININKSTGIYLNNNTGSDCGYYFQGIGYSSIMLPKSASGIKAPTYTKGISKSSSDSNMVHIFGATSGYTQGGSSSQTPEYKPAKRSKMWEFNNIYSTNSHGSRVPELIQGGDWKGYLEMTDKMDIVKRELAGSTDIVVQLFLMRRRGGALKEESVEIYGSDGTLVVIAKMSQGTSKWITVSSAVGEKIKSGKITHFYLNGDANIKFETTAYIWAEYRK